LHVALGALVAATIFAGCGSGGATIGSSGPNPVSTATIAPGTTPTPTLAPGASPTPTSGATASVYHPSDNGDAFAFNGSRSITYDRANQYPSPEPTQTVLESVTQAVAVTNPVTFDGNSNAIDFKISETDVQSVPAMQTTSDTLDTYYAFSGTSTTGDFLNLGSSEVFDDGSTASVTNGVNDQLADILPETTGAKWANMAGRTEATNDNEGTTSTTTYADDGSYTGTINYPYASDPTPNPAGTLTSYATVVAKNDGSGMLTTPLIGSALQYDSTFTFSAPSAAGSAGTITETTVEAPATGSTSAPTTSTTAIPNWMPATVPGSLYTETDVDNGPTALPSSCPVPTGYSSTLPNEIVETQTAVDPVSGFLDTTTTTTYDSLVIGPVCVVVNDVLTQYYDFTGQNGFGFFSSVPQQITTTNQVLYLQLESLQSIARRPDIRTLVERSAHVAVARARFATRRAALRVLRLAAAAHVNHQFTSTSPRRGAL
jgi:hypothetical protein